MNKNIYITVCMTLCIFLAGVFGKSYFDSFRLQSLYEKENYTQIIESFSGSQNPVLLHNVGNTYFKLFESLGEEEPLQKSLSSFSGSLSKQENEDTKYNYDFVKKLLEQLEQEQESNKQDEETQSQDNPKQNAGENNTKNNESEEQSSENQDSQENQQDAEQDSSQQQNSNAGENQNSAVTGGERGEQYSLDEGDEVGELSDEEMRALEAQIENLKQQQIYNQRYYGKQNERSDFDSLYESFFGEVDRGGEKTW